MVNYTFTIGGVQLIEDTLEVPEALEGLGSELNITRHIFPGDYTDQQVIFKVLPPIRWRGLFTGTTAVSRVGTLKDLCDNGQLVTLTYQDREWSGYIHSFPVTQRHEWLYQYELIFMPSVDLSTSAGRALVTAESAAAAATQIMLLHINELQLLVTSAQNGTLNPANLLPTFADTLVDPTSMLISSSVTGLQNAGNDISKMTASDTANIQTNAATVISTATPLASSDDPTVASPALDTLAHASAINQLVSTPTTPNLTTLQVTNPNLFRIAATYYGDASQWQLIADANGLTDPQPVGTYNALIVPALAS